MSLLVMLATLILGIFQPSAIDGRELSIVDTQLVQDIGDESQTLNPAHMARQGQGGGHCPRG